MQHPDVPMHLLRFVIRNKAQGSNLSVELPGTTENKELKEPKCCNDGISLFAFFFFCICIHTIPSSLDSCGQAQH